ncbi:TniQ protein [Burkholderia sp. OK233]|nr:TniQ protein [Burkholderia sp. OK233]
MAIALFPLLDGETIGSNLGRYGEFMGLETTLPLRRRLFGYGCRPDTRLPSGLRYLSEQARDYWDLDIDAIVKNHTEFFYATLTIDGMQREVMRLKMLDQPSGRCLRRRVAGWTGERVTRFRYCDDCLLEWREKGVPAHWLVDHQLPGAYFCCRHSRLLRMTDAGGPDNLTDPTVNALKGRSDEFVLQRMSVSERNAIEEIAKRSARYRAASDSLLSTLSYREFLREERIVWRNGRIDERAFIAIVLGHFGKEYCQIAGLTWQKMTTWIRNIVAAEESKQHSHPLMFIAAESLLHSRCGLPGSFLPALRSVEGVQGSGPSAKSTVAANEILNELVCTGILHRKSDAWDVCSSERRGWIVACSCGVSYLAPNAPVGGRPQLIAKTYGERYQSLISGGEAIGVGAEAASRPVSSDYERFIRWAHCAGFNRERRLPAEDIQRLRARWRSLVERAQPRKRITSAYGADSVLYRTLRQCDREWLTAFNLANRTRRGRSSPDRIGDKRNGE